MTPIRNQPHVDDNDYESKSKGERDPKPTRNHTHHGHRVDHLADGLDYVGSRAKVARET